MTASSIIYLFSHPLRKKVFLARPFVFQSTVKCNSQLSQNLSSLDVCDYGELGRRLDSTVE
jgi:hypothetical protein